MKLLSGLLVLDPSLFSRKSFLGHVQNGFITTTCTGVNFLLPHVAKAIESPSILVNTFEECPFEANLAPEVQVPGSYALSCMYLPARTIPLQSIKNNDGSNVSIAIMQGIRGPNDSATGRTGVVIWNSALLLTRLLDAINGFDQSFLEKKVVLELGMGTGISSIATAKLGAAKVYGTDGNIEVVELANANIETNQCSDRVSAHELKWGLINAADFYDVADIVIGSDLTYNSGSWKILAETISAVLKPGGFFLYLSLGHSGFNVKGEMAGFVSVAESEGLRVLNPSNGQRWPFKSSIEFTDFIEKRLTESEREILKSTGGVSIVLMERR